jgi:4-hydroxy-3-polyprenylbenzoate decarboxylase
VRQPDLQSFVQTLRGKGELLVIDREMDPDLEIAAIADRASRALRGGNKALLFTKVKGKRFPVLINALGSESRMNLACGVPSRDRLEPLLGDFLAALEQPRRTLREKLAALPLLSRLRKLPPRIRATGPCQDVVHEGADVDLTELPILRTWPDDAGPFITMGMVFTRDPDTGSRNCGMYRLQLYDKNTLGYHVHTHHTGAEHLRRYAALGQQRMPVAVAVGAGPAVVFSAVCPLPPGVDELLFAAFLQGQPVDLVRCRTIPLHVPATAEFVIEGYVDIDERRREGPFGDHTGFYSLADDYPVMHVTAITHRKTPIWQATVVGPPPQEDCWMGAAIERLFLPLQRKLMPELIDMRLPFAGVFHNLMLLKIRKSYPGQARKIAHTVWGMGQAMFTKVVVVFDEDAPDLREDEALLRLLLSRLDAARDLEFVLGPTETLDHASRALHFGSKVSLDLTRAMPGEGERAPSPRDAGQPPPAANAAAVREELCRIPGVVDAAVLYDALTIVTVEKVRPPVPRLTMEQVWRLGDRQGWTEFTDRVIVLDAPQRLDDPARLLWLLLANIDPQRDVERCGNPGQDASLRHFPGWHARRLGVDATRKTTADGFARDWPTEQLFPDKLLNKIANHWRELGFPGEMP